VLRTSSNMQESNDYIVMTDSSAFASSGGDRPIMEIAPISPAYVIDFFEARRRLLRESRRTVENNGMDREILKPASCRKRSLDLVEVFEEGGYWLIWVAVLMALALGMFQL
jgi:hypothetical protein